MPLPVSPESLASRAARWKTTIAISIGTAIVGLVIGVSMRSSEPENLASSVAGPQSADQPEPAAVTASAEKEETPTAEPAEAKPAVEAVAAEPPQPPQQEVAPADLTERVVAPPTEASAEAQGQCDLEIDTRPAGGVVTVGGQAIGTAPLRAQVKCGEATVRVTRTRYVPVEKQVVLTENEATKLSLMLLRPKHRLKISSTPAGATVTVNGRRVGKTPISATVIGFQTSKIRIAKAGYKPVSRSFYSKKRSTRVQTRLVSLQKKRRSRKPVKRRRKPRRRR